MSVSHSNTSSISSKEGGRFFVCLYSVQVHIHLTKIPFSSSIQRCSSRRKVSDDQNIRLRMSVLDAVYQNIKDGCRKKI